MTNASTDLPVWAPAMRPVVAMAERIADSNVSVLITGESGVGKEVLARHIHGRSSRQAGPFLKVNCAAFPAELLEAELLGHERGAFTGADAARVGKFELAHGGTLMLDEVGEIPAPLQAKLLHVLEDRAVTRLGSNTAEPVDVRVISATNRHLPDLMRAGNFRPDLYYRLQVIQLHVPPLRERRAEILPLAESFLARQHTSPRRRGERPVLSEPVRRALLAYDWPGNVRELENVMRRLALLDDEADILAELGARPGDRGAVSPVSSGPRSGVSLLQLSRRAAKAAERDAIVRTLALCRWNRRKAARELGVSYRTLLYKMKTCGLSSLSPGETTV